MKNQKNPIYCLHFKKKNVKVANMLDTENSS
jgi:hypothetical protein